MESCSHGGCSLCFVSLLSSECILIAIKWAGFTKNNHLMSCIHFVNVLHAVIIFIRSLFDSITLRTKLRVWADFNLMCTFDVGKDYEHSSGYKCKSHYVSID